MMKKKIVSLLLVLCLTFSALAAMTACTGTEDKTVCTHEWNEATCDAGKTCAKCGTTEGAGLGHNYIGGSCIFCGVKESGTPGAHTHSYSEQITQAATCTADGSKTLTCACGDVQLVTIRASHNYVSGTCTVCNDTATKEEIIAGTFENIPVGELLEEIKLQYNQTPDIDINSLLRYPDLYVNIPTYGMEASVKGGYVTLSAEGELIYIGFKDGNMVVVEDGKIVDVENIIPPAVSEPAGDIDATFDMLEEYIDVILSALPQITPEDLTYTDGWYTTSYEYNKAIITNVVYLVYDMTAEDELTDDKKAEMDQYIAHALGSVDIEFGFAMDGDFINGIKLFADADMNKLMGEDGTLKLEAEFKLTEDLKRVVTETIKFEFSRPSTEQSIVLEATSVPTYNADGSASFKETVKISMTEGETVIVDLGSDITVDIDKSGIPVKANAEIKLSGDEISVNEYSVFVPDGQGGSECAEIDGFAKLDMELSFAFDITGIENGNVMLDFDFKKTATNPKITADPILGPEDEVLVSAEQILAQLSPSEKSMLLDVSGSNFEFALDFSATGGAGKIVYTAKDADGFDQVFEIEVAVNSDKAVTPPRDIITLIQTCNPEEFEEDDNKPKPDTGEGNPSAGLSDTYNGVVNEFDKLLNEKAGQKFFSTEDEFEDMPEGAKLSGMCTMYFSDFTYMAVVYQCADAKSYELMLSYARSDMESDPDAAGWILTELGENVFILEMGESYFGK